MFRMHVHSFCHFCGCFCFILLFCATAIIGFCVIGFAPYDFLFWFTKRVHSGVQGSEIAYVIIIAVV